jgi:hypothetical protein
VESIQHNGTLLASIEDSIRELKIKLDNQEREAEGIRRTIAVQEASIAPISYLPVELLSRILLFTIDPTDFSKYQEKDEGIEAEQVRRLSLVSKDWHSVIQHGPAFWTTFTFYESSSEIVLHSRFQRWVAKSGSLPLRVVFHMHSGMGLWKFWYSHFEQLSSRLESVWLECPGKHSGGIDCRLGGVTAFKKFKCLERIVIRGFGKIPDYYEPASVPRLPALRSLYLSANEAPSFQAPSLRNLYLSASSRIDLERLWYIVANAPRLTRLNLFQTKVIYTSLSPSRVPKFRHLMELGSLTYPPPDDFQLLLMRNCNPTNLRSLTINFTPAFGKMVLASPLPDFASLKLLILEVDDFKESRTRIREVDYGSAAGIIHIMERAPNVEDFEILQTLAWQLDLVIQALLPSTDPTSPQIFPRLRYLKLRKGTIRLPTILHEVHRSRLQADNAFRLILTKMRINPCGMAETDERKFPTPCKFGRVQTDEDIPQELGRLIEETGLETTEWLEKIQSLFSIGSPQSRLEFLCNLFEHPIPPPPVGDGDHEAGEPWMPGP